MTLRHRFVENIPEVLEQGVLYVSPRYRTMVHRCACGCGEEVVTPLGPAAWTMTYDGDGVTIAPSIGNWSLPCRSHYWIERDRILWARSYPIERVDRSGVTESMVLKEQCSALEKAVKAGIERAREADLVQDYMTSVRFLAVQQFVFLGLQGIEFALKCILDKARVPFRSKHDLVTLFHSTFEKYPHLREVMQDEYDFWKDTAPYIVSEGSFLHRESRFPEFLKTIDTHNYQVDTRYFLLTDRKKTSESRIRLLLNRALDPRLLVHLWDKLNVFHDHEFLYQSKQRVRADKLYFRRFRLRASPFLKGVLYAPGDHEAERLAEEIRERANEYMRTGKARDLQKVELAWVRLQQWNEKQETVYSVWTSYKRERRSPE